MDTDSDSDPNSPAETRDVIIRDDRTDFHSLLDVLEDRRPRGGRVRLVDSGRFPIAEVEWLAEAGIDFYTSDLSRREQREFILLAQAARRGGAAVAYFHHGPIETDGTAGAITIGALGEMGRTGLHLYVSNGTMRRDGGVLRDLALACRQGGARFVYYHHGGLEAALEELCRLGSWVHVGDGSLRRDADAAVLADGVRATRDGGGIILHVEHEVPLPLLEDLLAAGVYILFQTPPRDYRDPVRLLEQRARRRRPEATAFYLHPEFLL